MKTTKANVTAEAVRAALQVFFMNESPVAERDAVLVTFCGTTISGRTRNFLFHVKVGKLLPFDTHSLAQELVKMVPNVAVTETFVYFFSRSISIICKELGKTGTYSFDFVHVTS